MPTAAQGLLTGLIDDAAMFPPGNAPLPDALSAHRDLRNGPYADLVGPLLCSDRDLRELSETVADPLRLGLIVSGGAGAIGPAIGHATKYDHVEITAVEIALRDEEDLERNAQRITRVLDLELPEGAHASIEVPRAYDGTPTASWWNALDEIAATGYRLKLRTGGEHAAAYPPEHELATFIDGALDRECPFKLTAGLHHAVRNTDDEFGFEQHGFLNVLLATRALFDGATIDEAASVLARRDSQQVADEVGSWDDTTAASTRRWFASFGSCSVTEPIDDLTALELLA